MPCSIIQEDTTSSTLAGAPPTAPEHNSPHKDTGGNAFANNGTNGGIDMAEHDAMWLYTHTSLKTTIVIY